MNNFNHVSDSEKKLNKQSKRQDDAALESSLGQASVAAIKQYLELADEQKLNLDNICQSINLDKTLLSDNSQHISGEHFQQLIAALLEQSNDDLFGLHTAKYVQPGSYSVLGFISMNCENLGQVISKIQPFEKLVGDMGTTTISPLGEQVKISWHCHFTNPSVKRHMVDNCLASWLTFARYLVNYDSNPSELRLSRQQPSLSQQQEYQAMFKCIIHYGQSENAIIFDKTLLAVPLNKGDPQLLSTLENHAKTLVSNLTIEVDIVTQLRNQIKKSLKNGTFHQQDMADKFGISTKTLQRRLTALGLSFQSLLDETRLTMAKNHLANSDLNLNQISIELGFTEPRSFYRWFNKLTQQTPGDFRKSSLIT